MAKGKKLNPADDYRKTLRKKELKKNKAERSKARDFALVKRDTFEIEQDIENLEAVKDLSPQLQTKLLDLKAELEKINRKKAEYVAEHPEQRRLVYRPRKRDEDGKAVDEIILPKRNLFKKNGLPRHPERSIYYDPQMNPFGVAPPGMPYVERPLRPDEVDSEADDENEDDIAMPEGPPPGTEEVVSDDDIPMPEGPPPGQVSTSEIISHPLLPPPNSSPPPPPLPIMSPFGALPPPPPPPPGYPTSYVPMPPPGFPQSILHNIPAPHPGFPSSFPPGIPPYMGPPPPGFFPRHAAQDPLATIPHHIYQPSDPSPAPLHPSLPMNPTRSPETMQHLMSSAQTSAATVFAAPQLRDFKKEATAFIPTALKRKKADASFKPAAVNAAPLLASQPETTKPDARPDLLQTLKDQFGPTPAPPTTKPGKPNDPKQKDDYTKFVEEMGDILT